MVLRSGAQLEAAVAIGTLDEFLVAHFEVDARVSERAATAVAAYAGIADGDDFGCFDGHELL
jgi:hypothetical protein